MAATRSARGFGAITYLSANSASSSVSLSGDLLAGASRSGTATREGGDPDTATINLGSLTDGVTGTPTTGRSFVNSGTLDYNLGGTFNISTIYFRLVNAVVDDRLAFNSTVERGMFLHDASKEKPDGRLMQASPCH